MVCRAPVNPRNISLFEPIFERSRLSSQFLIAAYEELLPTVQQRLVLRENDLSCEPNSIPEVRRA
jgi:hypothetical protein